MFVFWGIYDYIRDDLWFTMVYYIALGRIIDLSAFWPVREREMYLWCIAVLLFKIFSALISAEPDLFRFGSNFAYVFIGPKWEILKIFRPLDPISPH